MFSGTKSRYSSGELLMGICVLKAMYAFQLPHFMCINPQADLLFIRHRYCYYYFWQSDRPGLHQPLLIQTRGIICRINLPKRLTHPHSNKSTPLWKYPYPGMRQITEHICGVIIEDLILRQVWSSLRERVSYLKGGYQCYCIITVGFLYGEYESCNARIHAIVFNQFMNKNIIIYTIPVSKVVLYEACVTCAKERCMGFLLGLCIFLSSCAKLWKRYLWWASGIQCTR